jgi:hypothetical protein
LKRQKLSSTKKFIYSIKPLFDSGFFYLSYFGPPFRMPLKLTLQNVGLPDKFHSEPLDRLPMPLRIHGIPPRTTSLAADATPKASTLKALF